MLCSRLATDSVTNLITLQAPKLPSATCHFGVLSRALGDVQLDNLLSAGWMNVHGTFDISTSQSKPVQNNNRLFSLVPASYLNWLSLEARIHACNNAQLRYKMSTCNSCCSTRTILRATKIVICIPRLPMIIFTSLLQQSLEPFLQHWGQSGANQSPIPCLPWGRSSEIITIIESG